MQASEAPRAMAAAKAIAASLGLRVDDAIVLHDSNKLTLRLLPCDVLARVAPVAPCACRACRASGCTVRSRACSAARRIRMPGGCA